MTESLEFSDIPRWVWVYRFDDVGIFTGSLNFYVAPHTGLPANCTPLKCNPKAGQAGVWDGTSWTYSPDVRGSTYWDQRGNQFVMMELAALPEWAVTVAPPIAEPGHVLLFTDGKWQQLQDMTGKTFYGAYGHSATVPEPYFVLPKGCTFTPPDTPFDTWDGAQWVTDTQAQADAALQDAAQQRQQIVNQAQQQRQALRAAADQQIGDLTDAIELGMQLDGDADRLTAWKKFRVLVTRIDSAAAPDIEWPVMP
jgi:hypothetical protein